MRTAGQRDSKTDVNAEPPLSLLRTGSIALVSNAKVYSPRDTCLRARLTTLNVVHPRPFKRTDVIMTVTVPARTSVQTKGPVFRFEGSVDENRG